MFMSLSAGGRRMVQSFILKLKVLSSVCASFFWHEKRTLVLVTKHFAHHLLVLLREYFRCRLLLIALGVPEKNRSIFEFCYFRGVSNLATSF